MLQEKVTRALLARKNKPISLSNHPQACGENGNILYKLAQQDGPSPRVWGIRIIAVHIDLIAGPSPRVWGIH